MCLIIAAPSGQQTPKEHLENAFQAGNNDGWGVSYWNGTKVLVLKGFELDALVKAAESVIGTPHVIHLRWGTAGHRSIDNCHPFKIRKNLYIHHNGVLPFQPAKDSPKSDTAIFAGMLKQFDTDTLLSDDNLAGLAKMIGPSNKLAFQFRDEILFVNEQQGMWVGDRWYSNDYYHLDNWGNKFVMWDAESEWEKWLMGQEDKGLDYGELDVYDGGRTERRSYGAKTGVR